MPRRGRDLEKLVETLEKILRGSGVEIKSPDTITGIISKVPREIDVTLCTRNGFLVALECRDWTDAKQGVAWIEQLASKKEDLGVRRIVAVSSSDFSEGARNLARHFGVECRTLDSLTFKDVASWAPLNIPLIINRGEFSQVRIYLANKTDQEATELQAQLEGAGREGFFIDRETDQQVDLQEIWRRILAKNPQLFQGIEPNGEPKETTVQVDLSTSKQYLISTDEGPAQIAEIHFLAQLWVIRPEIPVSQAFQYTDSEGESMADVVHWEGKASDIVRGLTVIGIPKKGSEEQSAA